MIYGIILKNKQTGPVWFFDSILPGIVPDHVFDQMVDTFVNDELDLCKKCDVQGCRCHVIEQPTGRKLCPILFQDVVGTPWKVGDVV
jgi:hypothetical protein